jgi:hypothetical protein
MASTSIVTNTERYIPNRPDGVRAREWKEYWTKTHYPKYRTTVELKDTIYSSQYNTAVPALNGIRARATFHGANYNSYICAGRYGTGCQCRGCQHLNTLPGLEAVQKLMSINSCARARTEDHKASRDEAGMPQSLQAYIETKEAEHRGITRTHLQGRSAGTHWNGSAMVPTTRHGHRIIPGRDIANPPIRAPAPAPAPTRVTITRPRALPRLRMRHQEKFECSVCYDDECSGVQIKTECGHEFCYDCLMKWCETNNTCPLCRDPVPREEVARAKRFMKDFKEYMDY